MVIIWKAAPDITESRINFISEKTNEKKMPLLCRENSSQSSRL